ncbi:hypothetical protein CYLTODRAFT_441026 [Cylindrobasidium torrendii FP15055 ss-10]|uniref:Uncharacterized protein n=1 Tax=Cylindrobasidium torrendii FP15055 ss-10 TaxID=1314674 RepID=A0A0D7BMV5_9AGAR|nr:hypothetical protein CYLTODRAFT_441026 [Cylindrobasidium torrendii FP15055 ss-10]
MKSLRKSLNNKDAVRSHISAPSPLPSVSKPATSIQPPKKVIRALATSQTTVAQGLSFNKGDFFYVTKDVDSWYEAHNPATGARGLVPKDLFEEFGKGGNTSNRNTISSNSMQPQSPFNTHTATSAPAHRQTMVKAPKTFYAIVQHDFEAERADELDAKRGDAITVVAQSNREWFVAKPIGRLGRPGLIPVSFVEIHDPASGQPISDLDGLMDRGDLPRVEDWKKAMFNYKQNSIALGVLEAPSSNGRQSASNSPHMPASAPAHIQAQRPQQSQPPPQDTSPECLPDGILLSADVVSFHFEMDEYWFRIDAIFQPYPPIGQQDLPAAKHLILFRVYNDFYDFQVSLLNSFPREAGREEPHPRLLPYMPGPAQSVDDALTATRRGELDEYLHGLCGLSRAGCKHILEAQVIREFLAIKPGDVETAIEPRTQEIEELMQADNHHEEIDEYGSEIRDTLGRMRVESDGSDYEDEGYAPSPQRQKSYDRHPYALAAPAPPVPGNLANGRRPSEDNTLRLQAIAQNHNRTMSQTSINQQRTSSPYPNNSRSGSPVMEQRSQSPRTHHASASTSSLNPDTRSRSHSTSTTAPTISSANPSTAFLKIKIKDGMTGDLVAIRVHPKVTLNDLLDKVQTRLGGEVQGLRYQDNAGGWVSLENDYDLKEWIESTDKHFLFAE